MFDAEYWRRINPQVIPDYLRTGCKLIKALEAGNPNERFKKYDNDFIDGAMLFRDRILGYDWSLAKDKNDMDKVTEGFYKELQAAACLMSDLYYEMGFYAGLSVAFQLEEYKRSVE